MSLVAVPITAARKSLILMVDQMGRRMSRQTALMKPMLILLHQPVQQLPRRLALLLSSMLPLNLQEQNRRHPSLHVTFDWNMES